MEHFLETLIHWVAYTMEIIGIGIIVLTGIRALITFAKGKFDFDNPRVSLILAEGMNISLGFLLAAEIVLSIVVKTVPNLVILMGIAGLRVALTFVLHWEVKENEKLCKEHNLMCQPGEER